MEHGLIGYLFIIVALIFIFGGSRRLEDLGRGFGGFLREFNKAKDRGDKDVKAAIEPAKPDETKEKPQA